MADVAVTRLDEIERDAARWRHLGIDSLRFSARMGADFDYQAIEVRPVDVCNLVAVARALHAYILTLDDFDHATVGPLLASLAPLLEENGSPSDG